MDSKIQCPSCGADIDGDSRFCDQCGIELMVCPSCRSVCKSKFCSKCGKPSVKASELTDVSVPAGPAGGPAPVGQPKPAGQLQAITCAAMGVRLPLRAGAVIGRVNGDYKDLLARFDYISGTHARLDCNGGEWTITDLGSRNGTAVNGVPCSGAVPLHKGDVVRFARFYDFMVE
ncbi:MAG: FHA domain-containing protein [Bacteroidales bacterium]|nr:FHA domain-containing protein [Bacteroidales bacterium]